MLVQGVQVASTGPVPFQVRPQIPSPITMNDPRPDKAGEIIGVISFYMPGDSERHATAWDKLCNAGSLGNFWQLEELKIVVSSTEWEGLGYLPDSKGSIYQFKNSEAAFQALKYTQQIRGRQTWKNLAENFKTYIGEPGIDGQKKQVRQAAFDKVTEVNNQFGKAVGLSMARLFEDLTGDEAFHLKKVLDKMFRRNAFHRKGARVMYLILKQKFVPGSPLAETLMNTGDAYLLEHNSRAGLDGTWSDNSDGNGKNLLGIVLKVIRDELNGSKAWTEFFSEAGEGDVSSELLDGLENSAKHGSRQKAVMAARNATVDVVQRTVQTQQRSTPKQSFLSTRQPAQGTSPSAKPSVELVSVDGGVLSFDLSKNVSVWNELNIFAIESDANDSPYKFTNTSAAIEGLKFTNVKRTRSSWLQIIKPKLQPYWFSLSLSKRSLFNIVNNKNTLFGSIEGEVMSYARLFEDLTAEQAVALSKVLGGVFTSSSAVNDKINVAQVKEMIAEAKSDAQKITRRKNDTTTSCLACFF